MKFLRTYIDTHGIPESRRTDQFSGFKCKTMKKFCTEYNIEQTFCPVGDHRDVAWLTEPFKPSNEDWELSYWMEKSHQ